VDDNKVAVLLEDLLSKFRTFGEGQETLSNEVHKINEKVDGLIEDMDIVKPTLKSMDNRLNSLEIKFGSLEVKVDSLEAKVGSLEGKVDSLETKTNGLIEDMDIVKPSLAKIHNRLDNIEGEIIKLNPESKAVLKQIK
jgi:outer membrane murein-binding lipoprotein Lpp